MAHYILAHDLGTSGNKATLFDVDGKMIKSCVYAYDVHFSQNNHAEQDAEDWWIAVCNTTSELIAKTDILTEEIKAVSFSGQMMGCLCVDKNGKPLRPSMIWADQRAQKQAAIIKEHISDRDFYQIVGHRNTASYGIQKLMWVKENEPDVYKRTYKVLNAKDYIVYKLTGKFYTEYSDANSMGCFDLKNLTWSEKIIAYAGIREDILPELVPSTFVAGNVTKEAAKKTGLSMHTKVVVGAGDGVAANVGAGSVKPGKSFCCLGTSAWVATTTETPVIDQNMRTVCWAHAVPGLYSPNATMQYAGGSYSWLKNTICNMETKEAKERNISPYELMNCEAESSIAGANGVIFLPHLLGERAPRWNPDATGAYLGIRAETTRGDMIRSTLEGITMNLGICLDILQQQAEIKEILVIGGGAKGKIWRQIMADIFHIPIQIPECLEEANSMGAAVIGGVGAGLYQNFDAIDRFLKITDTVYPNNENTAYYAKRKELFQDSYCALEKLFHRF